MDYKKISETVKTVQLPEQKFDVEKDGTVFHVTQQGTAQVKETVYEKPTEGFGLGLLGLFLVMAALIATPLVCALVAGSLAIALPVGIGAFLLGCVCLGVGAHKYSKSVNSPNIVIKSTSPCNTCEKDRSQDVKQEKETKELLSEQQQNKTNNDEAKISTYNQKQQDKSIS